MTAIKIIVVKGLQYVKSVFEHYKDLFLLKNCFEHVKCCLCNWTTADTTIHSPQSWLLRGEIIACLNAWEANVPFCWAGGFCVASLLGRAVMQLFESLLVFMFGSTVVQKSGRGGECFVPRWNACHSDVPGRKISRGHNGIGWRSRVVYCFFFLSISSSI